MDSYFVNLNDKEIIINFIDELFNGVTSHKLILYGSKSNELLEHLVNKFHVCNVCSVFNYLTNENFHKEAEEYDCGCGSVLTQPNAKLTDYILNSSIDDEDDEYNKYIIINIK